MPRMIVHARNSILAGLLCSTSAYADVTAADVWASMKSQMEMGGMEMSVGSEVESGGVLTLQDIVMNSDMPEASVSVSLSRMSFAERGDGTVEVTLSPDYRIIASEGGEAAVEMDMTMTHEGLSLIASGTPDAIAYDYSADSFTMAMSGIVAEGEKVPMDINLTATGVAGSYQTGREGGLLTSSGPSTIARVVMSATARDPDMGMSVDFGFEASDLAMTAETAVPEVMDPNDFAAMLKAGYALAFDLTYGAASYDFAFQEGNDSGAFSGGAAGGALALSLDADALNYAGSARDISVKMSGSEIPLPEVSFALAEGSAALRVPLAVTEEPADFRLMAAYRGLTISDMIWGMFDPGQMLPRDPANIVLDISGKTRLLVDILDPEVAENLMGPPGELHALDVNDLEISLAGAALTGAGGFTFDNTDLVTFGGMPKPLGALDLKLVGGMGLMGTLVEMGFLPEDQAMGMEMMLGIFATPGEGEDTLTSKIEVTEEGQVLANGQPLQ